MPGSRLDEPDTCLGWLRGRLDRRLGEPDAEAVWALPALDALDLPRPA
ncbi:hypothetical protein [Streptomyces sp. OE57]